MAKLEFDAALEEMAVEDNEREEKEFEEKELAEDKELLLETPCRLELVFAVKLEFEMESELAARLRAL